MTAIYDLVELYNKCSDNEAIRALVPVELYYQHDKDAFNEKVSCWQDVVRVVVQYCTDGWFNPKAKLFWSFISNSSTSIDGYAPCANQIVTNKPTSDKFQPLCKGWYINSKCQPRFLVAFVTQAMAKCGMELKDLLIRCKHDEHENNAQASAFDAREQMLAQKEAYLTAQLLHLMSGKDSS